MNDPSIRGLLNRHLPLHRKQEEEWLENLFKKNDKVVLTINDKQTSQLIGTVGIHEINWKNRTGTTGTVIGRKEYRGKGYGFDAKMTFLNRLRQQLSRFFAYVNNPTR